MRGTGPAGDGPAEKAQAERRGPEAPGVSALKASALGAALVVLSGCAPLGGEAEWPPLSKKWFDRAEASYRQVDVEDAELAIENALRIDPNRPEIRVLAGRIALSRLEYDRALRAVSGLDSPEASAIRGRSYWYSGKLDQAAEELERLLADPDVRDPWAAEVAKLARRGSGREPFRMTGGLLAVTEMPYAGAGALIVPVELNGEPVLSLVATGTPEVVLHSTSEREPTWVSLRFGERVEVKDVPTIRKDLSGISKQIDAPIKLLLGVNLLRHLRPTIDYRGSQFIVRTFEPPPPPASTSVKLAYIRGGGMVIRSVIGGDQSQAASLLVDTSMRFPVALDEEGWRKAGVMTSSLQAVPGGGGLKHGMLRALRLGAFDVPDVPGVWGASIDEFEKGLDIDLDGMLGAGLLGAFRVTLVDGGRSMWLEDSPAMAAVSVEQEESAPPPGPAPSPGPAPQTSPKPAPPSGG